MSEELVSVIVPVYNVEQYLDRCIESIVNLTYKNIEILLMDDESPDNCGVICDMWAEKDLRIRVFHLPHGGLSAARNAGLKEMKGQYILFVDSDDYVLPDLLANAYNNMCKYDADMVVFDFNNFCTYNSEFCMARDKNIKLITKEQFMYMMYGEKSEVVYLAWNKLYKKEVFNGITYPVGYIFEDNAIIHRLLENCKTIVYDENQYYMRLLREDSITGKSKVFNIKNLHILFGEKERCELYRNLANRELVSCLYAEYFHTLIKMYYNTKYYLNDIKICDALYSEFCNMYDEAKGKVKFDMKKTIGYCAFRYFPKVVGCVMYKVRSR